MNTRLQWAVLIVVVVVGIGFAAYLSRTPGHCAYDHTSAACTWHDHGRAWYTMGH